jgi:hypothetical protein
MREPRKDVAQLGIIAVLVGILSTPLVPSASGQTPHEPPQLPAGESTDGMPAAAVEAEGTVEATQLEEMVQPKEPEGMVQATPWGTPVLVSPRNGAALYHYPRTTTLAWQPVTTAISYLVERAFQSGSTWVAYPTITVSGNGNASYTFDFVGDQRGRWRVTAYNGAFYSLPSVWWYFSYNTRPQMATPILTGPANNEIFGHFPRTITLSWKMVPAAAGYKLERAYCLADKVTCWNYPPITITGQLMSDYTFNFVGAQPGKWRVTTLGAPTYRDSVASGWFWFSFTQ